MLTIWAEIFSLMGIVFRQRFAVASESICFNNGTRIQILVYKFFDRRNLYIGGGKHLQVLGTTILILANRDKYTLISRTASLSSLDLCTKVGIIELNDARTLR